MHEVGFYCIYSVMIGNLMKRVLLLIVALLPSQLNAADNDANYSNANIHPLELTACGAAEQMHLLELAAQKALMAEERSNALNPSQKNTCDKNCAFAREIEKRARKSIEAKQNEVMAKPR
jgi:hypothetical protein